MAVIEPFEPEDRAAALARSGVLCVASQLTMPQGDSSHRGRQHRHLRACEQLLEIGIEGDEVLTQLHRG